MQGGVPSMRRKKQQQSGGGFMICVLQDKLAFSRDKKGKGIPGRREQNVLWCCGIQRLACWRISEASHGPR